MVKNIEEAREIFRKSNKKLVITKAYILKDRYVFLGMPRDYKGDKNSYIGICYYVYKKDGHIGTGYPTVKEMEEAIYV